MGAGALWLGAPFPAPLQAGGASFSVTLEVGGRLRLGASFVLFGWGSLIWVTWVGDSGLSGGVVDRIDPAEQAGACAEQGLGGPSA
ncbi:hypothetical protein GCM10010372_30310 [Streptomyces tauricus]|nr:hypothetical protein GCM10010372_30310 [Streptomyces tauricus]